VDGAAAPDRRAGTLARVPPPRFLQLADVAEVLNISAAQAYALVRNGDLPAIKVGGRGQWRVETNELEGYIARMYEETRDFVNTHPLGRTDEGEEAAEDGVEGEDTGEEQPATTDREAD
jgi:excisionase family DNA binding protein